MRAHRFPWRSACVVLLVASAWAAADPPPAPPNAPLDWPAVTETARPWAYWWWMGSAVDPDNLTRELTRYHDVGMGGVHIVPIYGAKGYEDRYIDYLSPRWMEMLGHAVTEARRMGMGVDMTLGTGWCFGGPDVTEAEACQRARVKTIDVPAGKWVGRLVDGVDPKAVSAVYAVARNGRSVELTYNADDGTVDWTAVGQPWTVYVVSTRPGPKVKRAAPGGEGYMLNPIGGSAVRHYVDRFNAAFNASHVPAPRAVYHDSYEYVTDWSPDLFAGFERYRGYRLQEHLTLLLSPGAGGDKDDAKKDAKGNGKDDRKDDAKDDPKAAARRDEVARVKCDYRETVSDLMVGDFAPSWVNWAHGRGMIARYQAHGSPANLLDLYAVADVPETEMFAKDRDPLVAKFASSAAHLAGHNLVSSETGTWLAEHFTETLGEMKGLVDELFASGVNHVFYHGTCYSPDDAPWPGWAFYASTEMNPRNPIWHDVPALNAYIARCQSVLQTGRPDNDVLLYWPIHDLWHDPEGLAKGLGVHSAREWFSAQPVGAAAKILWERGFTFDYVSDRQLAEARPRDGGGVRTAYADTYRVVLVPRCQHMPLATFEKLMALAGDGATIVFHDGLPPDVPGLRDLEARRAALRALLASIKLEGDGGAKVRRAVVGKGQILVGPVESGLVAAGVRREAVVDHPGVLFVRRAHDGGRYYFIANHGDRPVDGWVPLATPAASAALMDPTTGRAGWAAVIRGKAADDGAKPTAVYLQLRPGESVIVRTIDEAGEARRRPDDGPAWPYAKPAGEAREVKGKWHVRFVAGGPKLPRAFATGQLGSWTEQDDTEARRFAGTAVYDVAFDAPRRPAGVGVGRWLLDLGRVCDSARVRLNGRDLGTVFAAPFQIEVDGLRDADNALEVEVTNVAANRVRDLDRRDVKWKNFHDINVVNIDYKPFDAADWPVRESGLIGPVTLRLLADFRPGD